MSNSIPLHPEHGLNPTLSQCIICRQDTGEIALLGRHYKDKAPMHMVTSVEPCKNCRETHLKIGTMLVEANKGYKSYEPTGNLVVVKDEAFKKIFNQDPPKGKIVFVEPGVLQKLQGGKS